MNAFLDDTLVAIVLAASVGYALFSLGPKPLRRRLRTALADLAARAPARMHLGAVERRLREAADSSACGGCGSCETPSKDAAAAGSASGPTEIRVPAAKIGRRPPG